MRGGGRAKCIWWWREMEVVLGAIQAAASWRRGRIRSDQPMLARWIFGSFRLS